MDTFRKTIFAISVLIAIAIIMGIATVILSPKTLSDTVYDLIIMTVSGISIAIAIYSEVELNMESRRVERMIKQINEMRKNISNDVAIDKNLRYKLDKIIALDEQIYKKMGGRKKSSDLVKEYQKAKEEKAHKS
jgi:phosphate/sulfate permease